MVHQGVRAVQSNLAGEGSLLPPGSARPSQILTFISMPVDARVPTKLKSKIWQEEFIDFGSLPINHNRDGKFQLTIHNSSEGSSPSLAREPVNKPRKITTIDMWMQAFHVFVGV